MSCTATTFGRGVERFPWEGDEAGDGGDVDDASAAGEGGVAEQWVRELVEVEARLQVARHHPRVVLRRALRRRLEEEQPRVVHLRTYARTPSTRFVDMDGRREV